MLNQTVRDLQNQQINKEFYSAYLYLDFSNYYKRAGLDGFANWYRVQAQEERDHAMLFYDYLQNNDATVELEVISRPDQVFADVLCYETKALEDSKVELHAKFIDIQAVLAGEETICCLPTDGLEVIEAMDYERDRGFFKFAPGKETRLAMAGGTFALFLPGEGHLTGWNDNKVTIRKIVFKVAKDLLTK